MLRKRDRTALPRHNEGMSNDSHDAKVSAFINTAKLDKCLVKKSLSARTLHRRLDQASEEISRLEAMHKAAQGEAERFRICVREILNLYPSCPLSAEEYEVTWTGTLKKLLEKKILGPINFPFPKPVQTEPIPMRIVCPECSTLHIDVGEFETKLHHTHACQHCGNVWRPAVEYTVGVTFLPGFKNP